MDKQELAAAMDKDPEERTPEEATAVAEHDRIAVARAAERDAKIKAEVNAKRAAGNALAAQARKLHAEANEKLKAQTESWVEKQVAQAGNPVAEELAAMEASVAPARTRGGEQLRALFALRKEVGAELDQIANEPWAGLVTRAPKFASEIIELEDSVLKLKQTLADAITETQRLLNRTFTSGDLHGFQLRAMAEVRRLLLGSWAQEIRAAYGSLLERVGKLKAAVELHPVPTTPPAHTAVPQRPAASATEFTESFTGIAHVDAKEGR